MVLSDFLHTVFLHFQILISVLKGWDLKPIFLMSHERRYFHSLMLITLENFWSHKASIPVVLMPLVAALTKTFFPMFAQGNHNFLLLSIAF